MRNSTLTSVAERALAIALLQNLTAMGMQPYGMTVPTGYSMKAETWENEGALLARMNFSTTLTQGKLPGAQFNPGDLIALDILTNSDLPNAKATLAQGHSGVNLAITLEEDTILEGEFSAKDEAVIQGELDDPDVQRRMAASPVDGLRLVTSFILASPEFQHH